MRTQVEELLQADLALGSEENYLRGPLVDGRRDNREAASPIQIDGYSIIGAIGDGGMGTVYEAEQEKTCRRVALKVIRLGMASREMIKRFRLEGHVLERLQHPGIAQFYEAGLTANGLPFIAMELIVGVALNEYARKLAIDARIELMARVCDIVQYAHNQGVIHRDLKPANILVDMSGQPRVLDFGVARASDIDLQTTAAHTQTGQLIGSLSYMSPEQISANPSGIDWRADVYSLGVILFELITGRQPFELQNLPLPEAARMICELPAPGLRTINRVFRGDVETIVAKALEKDPRKRYASALELAEDLRRYLSGKPIQAQPLSSIERFIRWSQKNRALSVSMSVIAILITATAILSTFAALRFQESSDRNARLAEENLIARQRAERANEESRRRGEAERWERYRANISAAANALQLQNMGEAKSSLESAPVEHRNWEWRYLHGQLVSPHREFPSPYVMNRLAFCSDRTRIATVASAENIVLVWETAISDQPRELRGGDGVVLTRISSDAGYVVFGTNSGQIQIVDLVTGKEVAAFQAHAGKITALEFDSQNRLLASAGQDNMVCVWDLATAQNQAVLTDLDDEPNRLAVSSDGKRLLVVTKSLRLWDLEKKQVVATLVENQQSMGITEFGFCLDGQRAFSAIDFPANDIQLWDVQTGQLLLELKGHQNTIFDIACSADGSRIASASLDQTARYGMVTRAGRSRF